MGGARKKKKLMTGTIKAMYVVPYKLVIVIEAIILTPSKFCFSS